MSLRIGIMGGMFDPVHTGHLEAALTAQRLLNLDRVLMVPCGIPNHRERAVSAPEQRLAMLKLAIASHPRLVVDDRELRRSGVSYTVDTLAALRTELPDAVLFLIVGADSFNTLSGWHRWRDLFDLCHLVVVSRPGFEAAHDPALSAELQKRQIHDVAEFSHWRQGLVFVTDSLACPVSSTQVRERIVTGGSLNSMLEPEVIEYVNRHQLYRHKQVGQGDK